MIIISTEVPEFFKRVHSEIKIEPFGEFFLKNLPEGFKESYESFIYKIIEDFKRYNNIHVRIPVKGDKMFHNGAFYSVDVTDIDNPILVELKNHMDIPEIEIDLLDGFYYNGIEKISQVPQINMILNISQAFRITPLIDYLSSNNIVKQYVNLIDKLETAHELELYNKWVIHNLNLIKSV